MNTQAHIVECLEYCFNIPDVFCHSFGGDHDVIDVGPRAVREPSIFEHLVDHTLK